MSISRREFVAGTLASIALMARTASAQQDPAATMSGPMSEDAYRPVRLSPKAGASPSMSDLERDDLEHRIKCQCGCVLDIFTCRTTDFSCQVSPAMHRDVLSLVSGGYTAGEILPAFQTVYGERVLMAPVKEGFNWLGYLLPSALIGAGGIVLFAAIRRFGRRAELEYTAEPVAPIDATPAELDAVNAAMRKDR